jgi:coproporphyrinogen III oxidase-like Fe-S oxidoreductase
MTYMAILETINTDLFYEVAREKAEKAEGLLKQILKANPSN